MKKAFVISDERKMVYLIECVLKTKILVVHVNKSIFICFMK